MIPSQSKLLLTAETRREDAEVSKLLWVASSSAAVSSPNSLCWGSSTALKESSESFIALECSSQALSELDQSKGDSVFFYRTPSFSCIESSECYESGAETTTRIDGNGESLRCSKSKDVDAWVNNERVCTVHSGVSADNLEAGDHQGLSSIPDSIAPTDNKAGGHCNVYTENTVAHQHRGTFNNRVFSGNRASSSKLDALDLLIYAAIQVGFLDDKDDQKCEASLGHPNKTDWASDARHVRHKHGFPVHLSSPILKKKVVRCARSAFTKQMGNNMLQRLGIASPAKKLEKKVINIEKKAYFNTEKEDNSINNLKPDRWQQGSKAIQYTQRNQNPSKMSSERALACKADVSKLILVESGDGSEQGVLQASPIASSDVCDANLKGVQVQNRRCKTQIKQQKVQGLPIPEICGFLSKPLENKVKSEMGEDLCQVESTSRQKNGTLEEDCRETDSDLEAQQATQANIGGSLIRLKIRPLRLPSQILQEPDMPEVCEHITRRSKRLHVQEQERRTDVTMQPIDSMPCDFSGGVDTGVKDVDMLKRSKRARCQVLPTKFSDSVLQPWKRSYRKK